MRAGFDEALAKPRFLTKLVTWFAVVGLVLGLIGLYGVISLSVAQRTAEFGLRVALGASGGAIVRMVVRGALSPVLAGVAAGLLAGLGIGRLAAPLLYQIGPADPATFVAVPLVLIAASTISAAIPARRGARAAPMESLRTD
jgi:ABC-type antimicrobial peptide transport system permease subunit